MAVADSAYFELGAAPGRKTVKSSVGSFDPWRVVGVAAPTDAHRETFAAFSIGIQRLRTESASESASLNAQGTLDIVTQGPNSSGCNCLSLVSCGRTTERGLIGYYGAYPYFAAGQNANVARGPRCRLPPPDTVCRAGGRLSGCR
ncbi:MAG: hypothetical protein M3O46_06725 [Myxococcota bacterium]|nr:hypothetical protein [Myxococcota bacterium]